MAAGDLSKSLLAQARARLNEPTAQVWQDSDLYAYLNEAQLDLCDQLCVMALWPVTEITNTTLVAAQSSYSLPSDFLGGIFVYYKDYGAVYWDTLEMGALGEDSATANVNVSPAEDNPYYRIWGNQIIFHVDGVTQSNGDVFTLFYLEEPTDMGDSTDPSFPKNYAHALVEYAVAKARETTEDFKEAHRANQFYLETCSIINARYRGTEPYEGPVGDPAMEVQPE